jgi:hypothetical protein
LWPRVSIFACMLMINVHLANYVHGGLSSEAIDPWILLATIWWSLVTTQL